MGDKLYTLAAHLPVLLEPPLEVLIRLVWLVFVLQNGAIDVLEALAHL